MKSDGDVSVCSSSEESEDESDNEEIPNGIILDLYQEMQELQSNPLGLDRFSGEEKVHNGKNMVVGTHSQFFCLLLHQCRKA